MTVGLFVALQAWNRAWEFHETSGEWAYLKLGQVKLALWFHPHVRGFRTNQATR